MIIITWYFNEMTGEMGETGPNRLSFLQLGVAIDAYAEKRDAYSQACFVNCAYDEPGFATIGGQELADWKQEFPRTDDSELARLRADHEEAMDTVMTITGVESPATLAALAQIYRDEEIRQAMEDEYGPDRDNPHRTAISIYSATSVTTKDMIAGIVAMSRITGDTYTAHAGIIIDKTYHFVYATVSPRTEVEDILAQFSEHGLSVDAVLPPD